MRRICLGLALVGCGDSTPTATDPTSSTSSGTSAASFSSSSSSSSSTSDAEGSSSSPESSSGVGPSEESSSTSGEPQWPPGCIEVHVTTQLDTTQVEPEGTVYGSIGVVPDLGDETLAEVFQLEFYTGTTGRIPLGADGNENYETCQQCLRMFLDVHFSIPAEFFQSAGTILIDEATDPTSGALQATLLDVELVEVTIDENTFESTPVPEGKCIRIASPTMVTAEG